MGRVAEGVEEPEAELPGFGASALEEAAELTAPDGVTPPCAVLVCLRSVRRA